MTAYRARHRRRRPVGPRLLSLALLAAAVPLAGAFLPHPAPAVVWAAPSGTEVEAPAAMAPTSVPPPRAVAAAYHAQRTPEWVSPLAARVCRPPTGGGQWHAPRDGGSRLHKGIDLGGIEGLGTGTPIRAVGAGTVVAAGWSGGAGMRVNIDHGSATTQYQHLSRIDVHAGQTVQPGQQIGLMGNTGHSFGPHLHLGVVVNGVNVDPLRWLLDRGVDLRC